MHRAEQAGGDSASRLRELLLVFIVIVIVTAGWPLVNLIVPNKHPPASTGTLAVGPNHAHSALFSVGRGWSVTPSMSTPGLAYTLQQGSVQLLITYVNVVALSDIHDLWTALGQIAQLLYPGASLAKPVPTVSSQGHHGMTGRMSVDAQSGTATIFPLPTGSYAIEMILVAPKNAAPGLKSMAEQIMRSVRFPEPTP
jgi:hypothetical protein